MVRDHTTVLLQHFPAAVAFGTVQAGSPLPRLLLVVEALSCLLVVEIPAFSVIYDVPHHGKAMGGRCICREKEEEEEEGQVTSGPMRQEQCHARHSMLASSTTFRFRAKEYTYRYDGQEQVVQCITSMD